MILHDKLSNWLASIKDTYPRDAFEDVQFLDTTDEDHARFVRLWMLQGIPYCFKDSPAVFEIVREYVAERLGLDPFDVGLIGSARIGFSLASGKNLRPFTPDESDVDLLVVSETLHEKIAAEYRSGVQIWHENLGAISSSKSERFQKNIPTVRRHLLRGFMDTNMVPVIRPLYVPSETLTCETTIRNLEFHLIESGFPVRKSKSPKLRVYKSWNAALEQNIKSLHSLAQS